MKKKKLKNSRKILSKKKKKSKISLFKKINFKLLSRKLNMKSKNYNNNMNLLSVKEIFQEHNLFEEVLKLIYFIKKLKSMNPP